MTSIFYVGPVFHSERGGYPFRIAPARIATPVLAFGDFPPFLLSSPPTEAAGAAAPGPCAKDLKLPLTLEAGGPSTLNAGAAADVRSSSWLLAAGRCIRRASWQGTSGCGALHG
jgi:hypothetical protein